MPEVKMDAEMQEFANAVLESIQQAKRGEGRVTTPGQIMALRQGRPLGSVKAAPKVPTTIRLSPDVSAAFRATGDGWQTQRSKTGCARIRLCDCKGGPRISSLL